MRLTRLHFVQACNDRNARTIKQIRRQDRKSMRPGNNDFTEKLEKKLNRLSKLKPRGRPEKKGENRGLLLFFSTKGGVKLP